MFSRLADIALAPFVKWWVESMASYPQGAELDAILDAEIARFANCANAPSAIAG